MVNVENVLAPDSFTVKLKLTAHMYARQGVQGFCHLNVVGASLESLQLPSVYRPRNEPHQGRSLT